MWAEGALRRVGCKEADMDNIKFVTDLYEAFKRGDLPYIVERFGDLENSGVLADAGKRAPWHFPLRGSGAVVKYFEALMGTMEPIRLNPRDLAATGTTSTPRSLRSGRCAPRARYW
jgi:ketosteroid isomerase-like protein